MTQGGQVDSEDTLTVQGRLLDIVDNPLPGETIEIWLGGVFLTNVTTDATKDNSMQYTLFLQMHNWVLFYWRLDSLVP